MALSHDQSLLKILMMLFLGAVWCCLPGNDLLSLPFQLVKTGSRLV